MSKFIHIIFVTWMVAGSVLAGKNGGAGDSNPAPKTNQSQELSGLDPFQSFVQLGSKGNKRTQPSFAPEVNEPKRETGPRVSGFGPNTVVNIYNIKPNRSNEPLSQGLPNMMQQDPSHATRGKVLQPSINQQAIFNPTTGPLEQRNVRQEKIDPFGSFIISKKDKPAFMSKQSEFINVMGLGQSEPAKQQVPDSQNMPRTFNQPSLFRPVGEPSLLSQNIHSSIRNKVVTTQLASRQTSSNPVQFQRIQMILELLIGSELLNKDYIDASFKKNLGLLSTSSRLYLRSLEAPDSFSNALEEFVTSLKDYVESISVTAISHGQIVRHKIAYDNEKFSRMHQRLTTLDQKTREECSRQHLPSLRADSCPGLQDVTKNLDGYFNSIRQLGKSEGAKGRQSQFSYTVEPENIQELELAENKKLLTRKLNGILSPTHNLQGHLGSSKLKTPIYDVFNTFMRITLKTNSLDFIAFMDRFYGFMEKAIADFASFSVQGRDVSKYLRISETSKSRFVDNVRTSMNTLGNLCQSASGSMQAECQSLESHLRQVLDVLATAFKCRHQDSFMELISGTDVCDLLNGFKRQASSEVNVKKVEKVLHYISSALTKLKDPSKPNDSESLSHIVELLTSIAATIKKNPHKVDHFEFIVEFIKSAFVMYNSMETNISRVNGNKLVYNTFGDNPMENFMQMTTLFENKLKTLIGSDQQVSEDASIFLAASHLNSLINWTHDLVNENGKYYEINDKNRVGLVLPQYAFDHRSKRLVKAFPRRNAVYIANNQEALRALVVSLRSKLRNVRITNFYKITIPAFDLLASYYDNGQYTEKDVAQFDEIYRSFNDVISSISVATVIINDEEDDQKKVSYNTFDLPKVNKLIEKINDLESVQSQKYDADPEGHPEIPTLLKALENAKEFLLSLDKEDKKLLEYSSPNDKEVVEQYKKAIQQRKKKPQVITADKANSRLGLINLFNKHIGYPENDEESQIKKSQHSFASSRVVVPGDVRLQASLRDVDVSRSGLQSSNDKILLDQSSKSYASSKVTPPSKNEPGLFRSSESSNSSFKKSQTGLKTQLNPLASFSRLSESQPSLRESEKSGLSNIAYQRQNIKKHFEEDEDEFYTPREEPGVFNGLPAQVSSRDTPDLSNLSQSLASQTSRVAESERSSGQSQKPFAKSLTELPDDSLSRSRDALSSSLSRQPENHGLNQSSIDSLYQGSRSSGRDSQHSKRPSVSTINQQSVLDNRLDSSPSRQDQPSIKRSSTVSQRKASVNSGEPSFLNKSLESDTNPNQVSYNESIIGKSEYSVLDDSNIHWKDIASEISRANIQQPNEIDQSMSLRSSRPSSKGSAPHDDSLEDSHDPLQRKSWNKPGKQLDSSDSEITHSKYDEQPSMSQSSQSRSQQSSYSISETERSRRSAVEEIHNPSFHGTSLLSSIEDQSIQEEPENLAERLDRGQSPSFKKAPTESIRSSQPSRLEPESSFRLSLTEDSLIQPRDQQHSLSTPRITSGSRNDVSQSSVRLPAQFFAGLDSYRSPSKSHVSSKRNIAGQDEDEEEVGSSIDDSSLYRLSNDSRISRALGSPVNQSLAAAQRENPLLNLSQESSRKRPTVSVNEGEDSYLNSNLLGSRASFDSSLKPQAQVNRSKSGDTVHSFISSHKDSRKSSKAPSMTEEEAQRVLDQSRPQEMEESMLINGLNDLSSPSSLADDKSRLSQSLLQSGRPVKSRLSSNSDLSVSSFSSASRMPQMYDLQNMGHQSVNESPSSSRQGTPSEYDEAMQSSFKSEQSLGSHESESDSFTEDNESLVSQFSRASALTMFGDTKGDEFILINPTHTEEGLDLQEEVPRRDQNESPLRESLASVKSPVVKRKRIRYIVFVEQINCNLCLNDGSLLSFVRNVLRIYK